MQQSPVKSKIKKIKKKKSQAKSSNSKVEEYIQSRAASVQSIANYLFQIK